MTTHTHEFVESYTDLVGFGLNRHTDQNTLIVYLQKFSDDRLAEVMVQRMSDSELEGLFNMITGLLQHHLSEAEYHELFLRQGG